MKLKGKCLEEFTIWYLNKMHTERPDYNKYNETVVLNKFYREVFSMQSGVYLEFFDSKGIYIETGGINWDSNGLHFWNNIQEDRNINGDNGTMFNSRGEATKKAIEKANEILNLRVKNN